MSVLDDIIDGATDDAVSTANLLRKVQVAATRLGAREIVEWVKRELNGYGDDALPPYRAEAPAAVSGVFIGPMHSSLHHDLHQPPGDFWAHAFAISFSMPLAELEAFADGDADPAVEWPPSVVAAYEREGVFGFEFHNLFTAHIKIPREKLRGIIDSIRNTALEFALELQQANPEAGTVGGPTVDSDPKLASVVYNITNNVTGSATITSGSEISQSSIVIAGDFDALVRAAQEAGLQPGDAVDFAEAVRDEGGVDGPRVKGFLGRLQSGALKVVGDVSVKVATSELAAIALHYLGVVR